MKISVVFSLGEQPALVKGHPAAAAKRLKLDKWGMRGYVTLADTVLVFGVETLVRLNAFREIHEMTAPEVNAVLVYPLNVVKAQKNDLRGAEM